MSKSSIPVEDREPFRSFTVRVPISFYAQMSDLARGEGIHLNKKIYQLLKLGMGEHINLDAALIRLLKGKLIEGENV